jgi:hypothetical protein
MHPAQDHHAVPNGNRQAHALPHVEGANNWYVIQRADGSLDFSELSEEAIYTLFERIEDKTERGEALDEVEQAVKDYEDSLPPSPSNEIFAEAEAAGLDKVVLRWCMSYCPGLPPVGGAEVPNSIIANPLLSADERVYLAILLGHKGTKGIFPGEQLLGWYMERTPREIRRLNSGLVRKGLLKVERRCGHSNSYKVVPPKAATRQQQGYTPIPLVVAYDRTLEVGERLAFMLVARFQAQDEWCLHSVAEMASLACVGRRAFTNWMETLYRDGLVVQTEDRLRFGGTVGRRTGNVDLARELTCRELGLGLGVWNTTYVFYDGPMPAIHMELGTEPGQPSRLWAEPLPDEHRALFRCGRKWADLAGYPEDGVLEAQRARLERPKEVFIFG